MEEKNEQREQDPIKRNGTNRETMEAKQGVEIDQTRNGINFITDSGHSQAVHMLIFSTLAVFAEARDACAREAKDLCRRCRPWC